MHTETPIQMLSLAETCKLLCKSRSGLYKLMASDASFPRPIKDGTARQARVVFVSSELAFWQKSKLDARASAAKSKSAVLQLSDASAAIFTAGDQ